jgi:hypothetical protein
LDKFRDKVGNWREQVEWVEEKRIEVAECWSVLEDEIERRKDS